MSKSGRRCGMSTVKTLISCARSWAGWARVWPQASNFDRLAPSSMCPVLTTTEPAIMFSIRLSLASLSVDRPDRNISDLSHPRDHPRGSSLASSVRGCHGNPYRYCARQRITTCNVGSDQAGRHVQKDIYLALRSFINHSRST